MIQNWIQQGSENWTFYNIPLYLRVHGVWGAMKQFWAILARVVESYYGSLCQYCQILQLRLLTDSTKKYLYLKFYLNKKYSACIVTFR